MTLYENVEKFISQSRKEILRLISGSRKDVASATLDTIGNRTHGYVGADLTRLFECAMEKAEERVLVSKMHRLGAVNGSTNEDIEFAAEVTEEDLNIAMLDIRPSAMREVFLETPKIRWSDIGGQHHVKKSLRQAIEWPFRVITASDLSIESY